MTCEPAQTVSSLHNFKLWPSGECNTWDQKKR